MGESGEQRLRLKPGMPVEVLSMDNKPIFSGKVDFYDGKSVSVREARDRQLPVGVYGKWVKLRFESSENNLIVEGKICRSSPEMWGMEDLKQRSVAPKRSYFRQSINVRAEVACLRRNKLDAQAVREAEWSSCSIVDVSINGVQLSTRMHFQEGDLLGVRGARLVEGGPALTFLCRVLRCTVKPGAILCGCRIETIGSKEQKQLEEAIFTLQREEIRRRRERDRA